MIHCNSLRLLFPYSETNSADVKHKWLHLIDPEVTHSWQKRMEHLESHMLTDVKKMNSNINMVIITGQHCEQQVLKACKQRRWGDKTKRQKYWSHPAALCFSTSFTFSSLSQWQPAWTARTFFSMLRPLLCIQRGWGGRDPTSSKQEQNHGILLKYINEASWLNQLSSVVHRCILIIMVRVIA